MRQEIWICTTTGSAERTREATQSERRENGSTDEGSDPGEKENINIDGKVTMVNAREITKNSYVLALTKQKKKIFQWVPDGC